MKIYSVMDDSFTTFGEVVSGFDFKPLFIRLNESTPLPSEGTVYKHSEEQLEDLPIFNDLQNHLYGGMPIQIGYCNGSNIDLNALEYHRGSETIFAANDIVLLLAPKQKITNGSIDTAEVKAFKVFAGQCVLLYETTLHYAPCNAPRESGFRAAICLPKGTNTNKLDDSIIRQEDNMLMACNKWLLSHPNSPEAAKGAYIGLHGRNLDVLRDK